MKRLALVLGSLLVVGSVASAKEVMPAPTPAPEKVVEYVEKPVIVYRDREVTPAWRPNGSVDVQYRWYGETENKSPYDDKDGDWANYDDTNDSRIQTRVNLNFTEKQNLDIRVKAFQELKGPYKTDSRTSDGEYRIRHHYKFGKLGSSKVDATSRLEYRQWGSKKRIQGSVAFDFADYIYSNNFFKTENLILRPLVSHKWVGHDNDKTVNDFRLDLETRFALPLNFALEFNAYSGYAQYPNKGLKKYNADGTKNEYRGEFHTEVELYLQNHTPLYKTKNFELAFDFDSGYDTLEFHQRKVVGNGDLWSGDPTGETEVTNDRHSYQVFMLPTLQVEYKPTDFVKLYAAAGAEYRNWAVTSGSEARRWRWQPTAWAGMKVTF